MGKKNAVWRKYISDRERFADLINGYAGQILVMPGDLETLESYGIRTEESTGKIKEQSVCMI